MDMSGYPILEIVMSRGLRRCPGKKRGALPADRDGLHGWLRWCAIGRKSVNSIIVLPFDIRTEY
ncbi:Uncharacterised protein [Acinetobacter baumannii]|nr:hypothetical protein A6752_16375 [Pseudomonas aeruginosa]SST11149.1 Uncharacterised protein [Acinetobacter baumannii]